MEKFTKEMIVKYADKLLIGLTDEEIELVLSEFSVIDKQIDIINNIENIKDVEPMTHCLDNFVCELREDIVEESIDIKDLLSNCDSTLSREIKVPKVVE